MFISFRVLMNLPTWCLHSSLNKSSGQAGKENKRLNESRGKFFKTKHPSVNLKLETFFADT